MNSIAHVVRGAGAQFEVRWQSEAEISADAGVATPLWLRAKPDEATQGEVV